MALQGTLDTFELPDVLRLLASTCKSGRLHLRSDRGDGDVWLVDGRVVAVEAGAAPDVPSALFELLRAHEGAFAFEPGDTHPSLGEPLDVEPLLAGAETDLVEWREIEAVVPSLEAWVCLAPELPAPEMTVEAGTWRLVAMIGSGLPVGELGRLLGLGEVEVSRLVRDVVTLGLGAVTAPPAHAAPQPVYAPEPEAVPSYEAAPAERTEAWAPAGFERDVPAYEAPADAPAFVNEEPLTYADLAPVVPEPMAAFEPADGPESDELARQLAMLSPRAAEAVAAAAAAGSDDERQAALAAVDDDEPVNRGLLLKFLSSVKS